MKKNLNRLSILLMVLCFFLILFTVFSFVFPLFLHNQKSIFSFKKEDIQQIIQVKGPVTQHLVKDEKSKWNVEMEQNIFPADTEKVTNLLDSLLTISKQTIVSKNKNKHSGLGIGINKLVIKTNYGEYTLYVAEDTYDNSVYLRIDDQDEVFTPANTISPSVLLSDMRDLHVYLLKKNILPDTITITKDELSTRIEKRQNKWFIDKEIISQNKIDSYLQDLEYLTAKNILPLKKKSENNYSYPFYSIAIQYGSNIINADWYKISEELYELKKSDSSFIYEIPAVYATSLQKEKNDFIDEK